MQTTSSQNDQHLHLRQGRGGRFSFLIACLVGCTVWLLRPGQLIDTIWSDIFLANQRHHASQDIVIVNATARDLRAHGVDRMDRNYFAATLAQLDAAEVSRVVIDFNIGNDLLPEEEQGLLSVVQRMGALRLAVGYEPNPELRIADALSREMAIVDLRLIADSDGRFRQLCNPKRSAVANAGLWLATGELRPCDTPFDLRVDSKTFRHLSFGDLFEPNFDSSSLRGKLVVISLDQALAKSRANIPIHGAVDRGTLVAMAAHSQLTGYAHRAEWAPWISIVSSMLGFFVCYSNGMRAWTVTKAMIRFSFTAMAVLLFSLFLVLGPGLRTEPAAILLVSMSGLYIALAGRLGLVDLITGLFAGNLSPEEVWAWRTKADSQSPVVLFDAIGRIKRLNDAARNELKLTSNDQPTGPLPLAQLCMPGLGQRASQITCDDGGPRVWNLEWPHVALPLVVFHDVTLSVTQQEALRKKLITDPLTGVMNRVGFESRLAALEQAGRSDYAILFMDMNGFKAVNDTYGHEAGDSLLKATTARFSNALRRSDQLARLGGDEFAVLLEGDLNETILLRLRSQLEASLDAPIELGVATVKVGVAIGYGMPFDSSEKTADVLHRADLAMYARKAELKGRRKEAVCTPETAC